MKQTRPYIITALCLQMVLGAILLSCSTENDEYKKIHLRQKILLNP